MDVLSAADIWQISFGFGAAFIAGIIVVRWLLDYVEKHGFALFAWWRIIVGLLGFSGIYLMH